MNVTVNDLMQAVISNENSVLNNMLNHAEGVINKCLPRFNAENDSTLQSFINTTPLFAAIQTHNVPAVKLLLNKGADIKKIIANPDGRVASVYDFGMTSGSEEIANVLRTYALENNLLSKGAVSATTVVRSSKSQTPQYGCKTN